MVEHNNKQMTSARIEVELESLQQIKNIFSSAGVENPLQLCDGEVEVNLVSTNNNLAFDGGASAELILSFSLGVSSGVVANAFYAAICYGIKKFVINGRRASPTEKSIAQAIEMIKMMESLSENIQPKKKSIKKKGKKQISKKK